MMRKLTFADWGRARLLWHSMVIACLGIGLTVTTLHALDERGPTGNWQVVAGDLSGPDEFNNPPGERFTTR